uniref:Aspartyl/Glutamyl-tRNA(Gln) amidotransferase subunit B/E catalytic domain-containing protein n=1 Tax=Meloidogyne floridensis TaxID=298350 RepID=A0A915PDW3_9BILA
MFRLNVPHSCKNYASTFSFCFGRVNLKCFYSTQSQQAEEEHFSPQFQPIIGLELHAQIASKTKLFSGSSSAHNASVESNCHDSAIPGTLPRLNSSCIHKSLLAAVLLNCHVADFCRFDRKHYLYPDLPLASPIAKNGYFNFYVNSTEEDDFGYYQKSVGIEQIQLEMDSGKSIRHENLDLIDLNRAGIALIEIVTAPDFCNTNEVICFVEQLKMALSHNGICLGQFHEGNLRVDANVSVSKNGEKGSKVELKNLSGIGHMTSALNNEIKRQLGMVKNGELIEEETRAVDEQGRTFSARSKGSELDYRFIPEPNIPPLKIEPKMLKKAKESILLDFPYLSLIEKYKFPPNFTMEILNCKKLEKLIQIYLQIGPPVPFKHFKKWLDELRYLCEKIYINETNYFPPTNIKLLHCFAQIVHLTFTGKLTNLIAIDLMREFAEAGEEENNDYNQLGDEIKELIQNRNLWRITNSQQIDKLVLDAVLDHTPDFIDNMIAQKSKQRSKPFAKLKREIIDRSNKRIAPEDVDNSIWRSITMAV